MPRFMATYMGAEPGRTPPPISETQSAEFMQAWGAWAHKNAAAIVDGGAPIGRTKLVTAGGIADTRNAITAYTIVEAASHQEAASLFADHPHVVMLDLSVEVMQCLAIPGQ